MCIYIYIYCDLTIYHHNHTIQHAVGPHQVSWLDVLAQASPGSGRAVDLRTSLAIWLLWPGPHIGSGYPYPFAFRSPTFCLPAWSIFGHLPCLERPWSSAWKRQFAVRDLGRFDRDWYLLSFIVFGAIIICRRAAIYIGSGAPWRSIRGDNNMATPEASNGTGWAISWRRWCRVLIRQQMSYKCFSRKFSW